MWRSLSPRGPCVFFSDTSEVSRIVTGVRKYLTVHVHPVFLYLDFLDWGKKPSNIDFILQYYNFSKTEESLTIRLFAKYTFSDTYKFFLLRDTRPYLSSDVPSPLGTFFPSFLEYPFPCSGVCSRRATSPVFYTSTCDRRSSRPDPMSPVLKELPGKFILSYSGLPLIPRQPPVW